MSDELDLASVPWRPAGVRHLAAAGLGEPADGRGAHVGGLPVPGVGGAAQDPHRDDDHHLQEDLRQPRHPVEVGAILQNWTFHYIPPIPSLSSLLSPSWLWLCNIKRSTCQDKMDIGLKSTFNLHLFTLFAS